MKPLIKLLLIAAAIFIALILTLEVPLKIDRFFHFYSNDSTIDTNFYSKNIPADYLKILNNPTINNRDSANENIHFDQTIEFKHRNPISYFTYQKKYHLQICKIDSAYNLPVDKNLIASNLNSDNPQNAYYTLDKETNINYWYKGSISKPGKIHLQIFGNNASKIIKNDSIGCYYATMRNFSIRYNQDEKPQIFGNTTEDMFTKNYQPIEILFFKHLNNLYLLIMSKDDQDYKKGTLLSLIQNH